MKRFLLLALCLSPISVSAQTVTLTVNNTPCTRASPCTPLIVSGSSSDCSVALNIRAAASNGSECGASLTAWVTGSGTCGDTAAAGDTPIDLSRVDYTIANTLPIFAGVGSDAGTQACPTPITKDFLICASRGLRPLIGSDTCTLTRAEASFTISYKGAPPPAPSISLSGKDRALDVAFVSVPTEALYLQVEISLAGSGNWQTLPRVNSTQVSYTISPLTNDVSYDVRARAIDQVDNVSGPSAVTTGMPVASFGFYDRYLAAGGQERGGCGGVGAMLLAFCLPGVAIGAWARRKRSCRR